MTWSSTPQAQALLEAIRIEQPRCRYLHRYAMVNDRYPRFDGKNAAALRALWEQALSAAMVAKDHDAFARLSNHEHPDDIIEQMLADAEQLTEVQSDPFLKQRRAA